MAQPSPLTYVLSMADEALTVRDLTGGQQLWTLDANAFASDAAAQMRQNGFDVAPVAETGIERFATREDLERTSGSVLEAAQRISLGMTLDADTPLTLALSRLAERGHYFVVHRGKVTGVVSRADISKPAVALLTLGLVLSLEQAIDQLILRAQPEDFLEFITESRASEVRSVYEQRRRTNTDISLVQCLNINDRLRIVNKLGLHPALGFTSKKAFDKWSEQLKRVRDSVAHASGLLEHFGDPVDAIEFIKMLRERCEMAWAEVERDADS